MKRVLSAAVACLLPLLCNAECLGPTPIAAADTVYHLYRDLHNEPPDATYQAPRLFKALKAEYDCKQSRGEICAIDHDPWTGAQEGTAADRAGFRVLSQTSTATRVEVTFDFRLNEDSPLQAREVVLSFEQSPSSSCWLLSDLHSRHTPLLQVLEDFHRPVGSPQVR